ncbi:hypothetical protein FLL71_05485 [Vibrio cholerae]|nr:hypothetical protein FLL71_05485 [Vibrio cholerae]
MQEEIRPRTYFFVSKPSYFKELHSLNVFS